MAKKGPRLERSFSQPIEVFHANDPSHGSNILKGLHKLYKDQRYCDVTLNIGDERKLRVHRNVLASFSGYFEARLGSNWEEGRQDEVELLGFDESVVSSLIEFAYSGNIDISTDNVQTLLEAANYLGVEFVQNSCAEFLKKAIDDKTCLGILHLADIFALEELKKVAKQHALRHFTDVCKEEEFVSLPYYLLVEALKNEEVCVVVDDLIPHVEEREKIVLQAVFQYVEHDLESRREHLPELLSLVRLPTLSVTHLQDLSKHELIVNHHEEVFDKAQNLKVNKSESDLDDSKWASPRDFAKLETIWGRSFANGGQVQPEKSVFSDKEIVEGSDNDAYIKGVKLWVRRWDGRPVLGGLKIFYSDNRESSYGNDTAQEQYEFHLEENEKIVKVDVQSGWMIDRLTFYTNKHDADGNVKVYGPYGGGGGGFYSEHPAGSFGYLAGVAGTVVHSQEEAGITRLQFAWKTYVFPGDPKPPQGRCRVVDELEDEYSDEYDYSGDEYSDVEYSDFEYYDQEEDMWLHDHN